MAPFVPLYPNVWERTLTMVTVIRCPACGALWEAPSPLEKPQLRCSACQTLFHFEKAESVVVDKAALMERQQAHVTAQAQEQAKAKTDGAESKGEGAVKAPVLDETALKTLAADVQDFEARTEVEEEPKRSWFAGLWVFLMIVAAGFVGLIFFHKPLFNQVPALAPLYDTVCTTLPCQNFVRSQSALVKASVRVKDMGEVDVDGQVRFHPVLVATILNTDTYAEHFPSMNLVLKDAAGTIVAQRVLDPSDYGMALGTYLAPKGSVTVTIYVSDDLPVPVTDATLTALSD